MDGIRFDKYTHYARDTPMPMAAQLRRSEPNGSTELTNTAPAIVRVCVSVWVHWNIVDRDYTVPGIVRVSLCAES